MSERLNPIQFPYQQSMFMPAAQLLAGAGLGDQRSDESRGDLVSRKLRESRAPHAPADDGIIPHGAGVFESVRREGVKTPITVSFSRGHFTAPDMGDTPVLNIGDGHHRLASAAALGQEVPVGWADWRSAPGHMLLGEAHEFRATKDRHVGYNEAVEAVRKPR